MKCGAHLLWSSAALLTLHLMGCAAAGGETEQPDTTTDEVHTTADAGVDAEVNPGADDAAADEPEEPDGTADEGEGVEDDEPGFGRLDLV